MVPRTFWMQKLEEALKKATIVWLAGVRRAGKTTLVKSLEGFEYFDCEFPEVRDDVSRPREFLERHRKKSLILDEVHRLNNPSEVLKIAADHYPDIHIIATGSSSLGISSKFRDTLTGRKEQLWLTPMVQQDMKDFGDENWEHRFMHGGLPPFFLGGQMPEDKIRSWIDDYWAKDIQELFRLGRRASFMRFADLLFLQSGGMFEATRFTDACEVSRKTIMNYLSVLEETYLFHRIRPFSSRRSTEIVKAPKVYAFDTGFVCASCGWHELRESEKGILWEHVVLNEIMAHLQRRRICYWRDKSGHEVDFILPGRGSHPPIAIECKWGERDDDLRGMQAFARRYPKSQLYVVYPHDPIIKEKGAGDMDYEARDLSGLIKEVIARKNTIAW